MQQVGRLGSVLSISAKGSWVGLLQPFRKSKMFVVEQPRSLKNTKKYLQKHESRDECSPG